MDINDFKTSLINDCLATAEISNTTAEEEFINYMISEFENNQEIFEMYSTYFEMTGSRGRKIQIDGWGFDEAEDSFILFCSHFDKFDQIQTLTNSDIEQYVRRMEAFVENSINKFIENNSEFASEGRQVANTLRTRYEEKRIAKFKFYIITNVMLSKAVKNVSKDNICDREVQINIWDLERIYNSVSSNQKQEEITIDVEKYVPKGLKCIQAFEEENDEYTAYLAVMPGAMLAKIYEEYGSRLLEGNVRSFLTMTGKVNKGIRNTIENQPTYFFTYNNGIATTAKSVAVKNDRITQITNLQIINGGQTTASIFFTKFNDKNNLINLSKVFVPMKLTVIKNEENYSTVIEKISRYSNTQNTVSDADFFSNSPFHIEFKEYSNTIFAPRTNNSLHDSKWFYERTRGSYKQEQMKMTKAEQNKFQITYPKNQVITKTDLGKYYMCFLMKPQIVSKGAQTSMKAFAEYYTNNLAPKKNGQIDTPSKVDEKFYKDCIALAIIFKKTDATLQKQTWYPKGTGYKANIVAYSIAKLFDTIQEKYAGKNRIDLSRIWNEQNLYPELLSFLMQLCRLSSEHLNNENRPMTNVSEWAKRDLCWTKFQEQRVEIPFELERTLISESEIKQQKSEAKKEKKLVSDVNAQIEVVKKGPDFWSKVAKKCMEKQIPIQAMQQSDLKTAINMNTKRPPNSFESKRLLKFLEYAESEGLDINNL